MASNLFTSALSGMNAAQYGLATTEHNIANATTPGYNRQEVVLSARIPQSLGGSFLGEGVDIAGVKRIYDQFLSTQVLQEQSQASYLSTYHTAMKQIDNLVADPVAGASPAIQDFFSAVNGVSSHPESIPARQTLLGGAQFVVNRFQAIDQRLTDISNSLTSQISGSVNTINTYAQQIAILNGNIKRATAVAGNLQQPNDLLDQRDQLVSQLNKEIKVSVQQEANGTLSVFIGNGQTLVIDEQAMSLRTVQSSTDPSRLDIAYKNGMSIIPMQQSSFQGGNLGAYFAFRDQSLEPARNALGRVALGLAYSVNQQNQMGQDLNGVMGGKIFNAATPSVSRGAINTGTATVSATIADISALTTSDYQLRFDGTNYSMLRLSDNVVTGLGATLPKTVDGFSVSVASGAMAAGDTFLIRPTANGARDLVMAISDPARIAAALPLRAVASVSATSPATNTATVAGMAVSMPSNTNLTNPVTITFSNATTYTVTGAVPAVAGPQTYTAPNISYNGWTMQLSGAPVAGDVINVAANSGTAKVSSGELNLNPVSINFDNPPTTYSVVEMRGVPASPVTIGTGAYTAGNNISYNGWTVQIAGAPAAGDVFNVSKGGNAGSMFAAQAATNSGAGTISGGTLSVQPYTILFNNPPTTFTVSGAVPAVVGSVPYVAGQDISYNGWTIQVTGVPVAGDVFSFAPNTNGIGDNRNALLLASVQTQNLLANGTTSFQGAYSQLVGYVGAKTHELDVTSQAQNNMVTQTVASQQSVSGVNLDEEAANLLRYQHAYQAAAKAMQIASTMFDAVLALGR